MNINLSYPSHKILGTILRVDERRTSTRKLIMRLTVLYLRNDVDRLFVPENKETEDLLAFKIASMHRYNN